MGVATLVCRTWSARGTSPALTRAPEAVVATLAEAAVSEFLLLWLWHVVLRRSHIVSDFPGPFMIYDLAVESILAHTKIRREHKSCMEREVIGTE